MTRRVIAALALGVSLAGAAMTWRDFRRGRSRLWLSGGTNIPEFRRDMNPGLFWPSTALNLVVIAVVIGAGAMLVSETGSL